MANQKQTIFYFYDPDTKKFFFYEDHNEAKKKREESGLMMQFKTLKRYYGTIYLCTKGNAYSIHDHVELANANKQYGYKVEKIVLTDYEIFKQQFEPDEEDDPNRSSIPPTVLF